MTPAFCAPLIHGGCWHKKVVVPDLGWVVVRANDSESKFAFSVAVLTLVVVAHQFRQKSASISDATSRRRFQCRCCASRTCCPKLGTCVCEFHVFFFCEGDSGPLHVLRKVFCFFGKFERENVARRSHGGTRAVENDSGHGPLCTKPEGS